MKIKDFYLNMLNENEDFFYLDEQSVGHVIDVNINKAEDYLKIDFETTYGKQLSLVAKYHQFKKWYKNNIDKFSDAFKAFAQEFINKSKEDSLTPEPIREIIDDDGNIMPSTDKPNNSTNTMVGADNNWDLEKLYKSSIPKSTRFFSGDFGNGVISW